MPKFFWSAGKEFRRVEVLRFARRDSRAEQVTAEIAFCGGILPERRGNLFKSRRARSDHKATRSRDSRIIGIIDEPRQFPLPL